MSVDGYLPYSRAPADLYKRLTLNAGIIVDDFDPDTGEYGNIIAGTTGGIEFDSGVQYLDLGQQMDDILPGTMEHYRLRSYGPRVTGTFVELGAGNIDKILGPTDADESNDEHFIPRASLNSSDFHDIWIIGDYGDANWGDDCGYVAIHIKRALNVKGMQAKSVKNGVASYPVEFRAFYTSADVDDIPFEIYVHPGTYEPGPEPPSPEPVGPHSPRSEGSSVWNGLGFTWSTNAEEEEE